MKIVNCGSLNLDYVYQVDHFTAPGETQSANSMRVYPGGKGLNQTIAVRRAGAEIAHAGILGNGGELLETTLRQDDIDISFLQSTDTPQGNAIIEVNGQGENRILIYGGSNNCFHEEMIRDVLSNFSEGDFLILQNETNCIKEILEEGKRKKMTVFWNPSPFTKELLSYDFSAVSWLLVNQIEAEQIAGVSASPKEVYRKLSKKYPGINVVVTLGSEGAVLFSGKDELFVPSEKTAAVDTTAAGDTFTGYFIASLGQDLSLEESMRRATKAAGICVSKSGAVPSIPYSDEI